MKKRILYKMISMVLALFLLASCRAQNSGSQSSLLTESETRGTESTVMTESRTNVDDTSEVKDTSSEQTTLAEKGGNTSKTEDASSNVSQDANKTASKESSISSDEKYICKATLDDNFSDDKVLFVINKELSKSDPEFTPEDFKNIEIAEIERITSAIGDLLSPSKTPEEAERKKKTLALTNLEEFRHIYAITLKNPSKENVLKAVKELEKIDYIVSAEPNYYFSFE